jgi:regulator of nucleoside diphosphate kinase
MKLITNNSSGEIMSKIYITQFDKDRLMKLLDKKKPHDDFDKALLVELNKGDVVDPKDIPPDVITMNSEIRFRDEYDDDWEYWLVFPEDADLTKNKISILSPIGCALLGYAVGDKVTLHTALGRKDLTVKEVIYQPERAGNFNL